VAVQEGDVGQPLSSRGEDWSVEEVETTVADYFDMLQKELAGVPYSKTEHRRRLLRMLAGRNGQAVEFKHANISAVLKELGLPFIDGYKPRGNYQALLERTIVANLERHPTLLRDFEKTEAPSPVDTSADTRGLRQIMEDPPTRTPAGFIADRKRAYVARKRDLALLDDRRRTLGARGEEFVVWLERRRLEEAGVPKLAKDVVRISETEGDGAGYDVRSFEADGRLRHIEVKTTTFGKVHPFIVSVKRAGLFTGLFAVLLALSLVSLWTR
jgi:hypothetical protein